MYGMTWEEWREMETMEAEGIGAEEPWEENDWLEEDEPKGLEKDERFRVDDELPF